MNKATDKAGLSFNVNETKKWIKKQLEISGHIVKNMDGKNEVVYDLPKFTGAHIALTAIIESMIMNIMNEAISHLPKDISGLYILSLPALSLPLQLNTHMKRVFLEAIEKFDPDINYSDLFWISKKDIYTYIEKKYGDNIKLDARAFNLMCYILVEYASMILKTAHYMMLYAKKKSLDTNSFRYAVLIHTPDAISNIICQKLDDAVKNTSEKDDDDDSDDEKSKKEDKKEAKKTEEKKTEEKKSSKKPSKKSDSEDSSGDELSDISASDESGVDDSGDESSSSSEEDKKKKKTKVDKKPETKSEVKKSKK
jgi:hypothetical protein